MMECILRLGVSISTVTRFSTFECKATFSGILRRNDGGGLEEGDVVCTYTQSGE